MVWNSDANMALDSLSLTFTALNCVWPLNSMAIHISITEKYWHTIKDVKNILSVLILNSCVLPIMKFLRVWRVLFKLYKRRQKDLNRPNNSLPPHTPPILGGAFYCFFLFWFYHLQHSLFWNSQKKSSDPNKVWSWELGAGSGIILACLKSLLSYST